MTNLTPTWHATARQKLIHLQSDASAFKARYLHAVDRLGNLLTQKIKLADRRHAMYLNNATQPDELAQADRDIQHIEQAIAEVSAQKAALEATPAPETRLANEAKTILLSLGVITKDEAAAS
jgi:hypothetical protein